MNGQEVVHIATEHWWVAVILFSAMLAVIASAIKIRRIRKEMQTSLSRLSASERSLDEAKRQMADREMLIKSLKEKIRDVEGSVERGVAKALINCGLKASSLETFGEKHLIDDAVSADLNLTAEEEEELDEIESESAGESILS